MSSNENLFWTNADVQSLMEELEYVLSLMSPYYSQCNAGDSAYQLLSTLKKKQELIAPYFINLKVNSSCPICNSKNIIFKFFLFFIFFSIIIV